MIKTKKASGRTIEENCYYWGCVLEFIMFHKGWTQAQAHQWVKDTFDIESTAILTTIEFEELMENVRQHVKRFWNLEINLPKKRTN